MHTVQSYAQTPVSPHTYIPTHSYFHTFTYAFVLMYRHENPCQTQRVIKEIKITVQVCPLGQLIDTHSSPCASVLSLPLPLQLPIPRCACHYHCDDYVSVSLSLSCHCLSASVFLSFFFARACTYHFFTLGVSTTLDQCPALGPSSPPQTARACVRA